MTAATHTDYLHPRHLRVPAPGIPEAWNATVGWYTPDALCVAPSSADYAKLNKPGLPSWSSGE